MYCSTVQYNICTRTVQCTACTPYCTAYVLVIFNVLYSLLYSTCTRNIQCTVHLTVQYMYSYSTMYCTPYCTVHVLVLYNVLYTLLYSTCTRTLQYNVLQLTVQCTVFALHQSLENRKVSMIAMDV